MNWSDPGTFFAMGGHGIYVWGSMGVTTLAFCVEWLMLQQRRKSALLQIRQKQTAENEITQ